MMRNLLSAGCQLVVVLGLILVAGNLPAHAQYNAIKRVNVSSSNLQSDEPASSPQVSGDGRYVVFSSSETELIVGDTNALEDVFIYDRQTAATTRVSVGPSGLQSDGASTNPLVSNDGRYVAFLSSATNLVVGDTNANVDVFVHDRNTAETERVSLNFDLTESQVDPTNLMFSGDGRYVGFISTATTLVAGDTNGFNDIFVYDRQADTITRVSLSSIASGSQQSNANVSSAVMSNDGRSIAFLSAATNLVVGDTNGKVDVFVRDLQAGDTTRVNLSSPSIGTAQADADAAAPSLSSTGRYVAYQSAATNLVAGDTNGKIDIFVHDQTTDETTRPNVRSPQIQGNGDSTSPIISSDGRYVIFESVADNLIAADTNQISDIFSVDTQSGTITRVSVTSNNLEIEEPATSPSLSTTSQFMAFLSSEEDFIVGDTNDKTDAFVVNLECLLGLTVTPPTDTDSDGTADCSDQCGADAGKTAPGTCGCGIADTDSDSDATADCLDLCPNDAGKVAVGTCGCGVSDADANGNGVADCLDPTASTIPAKPRVRVVNQNATITIPIRFTGVTYQVELRGGGKTRRKTTTKEKVKFKNLPRGKYRVKYRITLGTVTTQYSQTSRVNVP